MASPQLPASRAEAPAGAPTDAPLAGVRVVELATGVAAAAAGRALADLGASVVKIDPQQGTQLVAGALAELLDAGKELGALPAGTAGDGLAILLEDADGLILDGEFTALAGQLPQGGNVVVLHFDAGPADAGEAARLLHRTSQTSIDTRGTIPVAPPGNIPYYDAAMTGVFAFLATRWYASENGQQRVAAGPLVIRIDTAAVELAHGRPDLTRAANESVSGERDPFLALFLECGDGEIAAHINRAHWTEWVEIIGRPELDEDPRFATMADLLDNQAEAIAELERWCQQRTRDDIERLCQLRGIPVGAVLKSSEVTSDRQLVHRGFVGTDGRPAFLPFRLSDGTRWRVPGSPPPDRRVDAQPAVPTLAAT